MQEWVLNEFGRKVVVIKQFHSTKFQTYAKHAAYMIAVSALAVVASSCGSNSSAPTGTSAPPSHAASETQAPTTQPSAEAPTSTMKEPAPLPPGGADWNTHVFASAEDLKSAFEQATNLKCVDSRMSPLPFVSYACSEDLGVKSSSGRIYLHYAPARPTVQNDLTYKAETTRNPHHVGTNWYIGSNQQEFLDEHKSNLGVTESKRDTPQKIDWNSHGFITDEEFMSAFEAGTGMHCKVNQKQELGTTFTCTDSQDSQGRVAYLTWVHPRAGNSGLRYRAEREGRPYFFIENWLIQTSSEDFLREIRSELGITVRGQRVVR